VISRKMSSGGGGWGGGKSSSGGGGYRNNTTHLDINIIIPHQPCRIEQTTCRGKSTDGPEVGDRGGGVAT